MSFWANLKQRARTTGYLFDRKSNIERYFLEATCNDQSFTNITDLQLITAARLSYEKNLFIPLKDVIVERLSKLNELISVKKTLILIEFILKNGNGDTRLEIIEMQPLLESISCSKIYKNHKNPIFAHSEIENKRISQNIILLINDDIEYLNERNQAKEKQEKIKNIKLNHKFSSPNRYKYKTKKLELKENAREKDNADSDSITNETNIIQMNEANKSSSRLLDNQNIAEINDNDNKNVDNNDNDDNDDNDDILFEICENEKKNSFPNTPQPKTKNSSFDINRTEDFNRLYPLTPNTTSHKKKHEKFMNEFELLQ